MAMPDFQDFMATLDGETISSIMKDANNAMKLAEMQDINCESIPGAQLLSASFQIALELLAIYHKWLEKQL